MPASLRARRSHEALVRRLFSDHEAAIGRLAYSMLKDFRDVEEAVQDTFAKACAGRHGYRGEAAERTWLHRICFNLCVDRLRCRRPDCAPLDPDMGQPAGEHEPELRVALWREIEALPLPLQAPVKLKLAGYSITEIAELAGIPRTTVGGRYNSACEQLRQRLDPHLDECSRSEEGS